jgi:hypothetical protein
VIIFVVSVTTGARATAQRARSTSTAEEFEPGDGRAARRAPAGAARADLAFDGYDVLLLLGLAVGTVLVHPVSDMLSHAYWLDESWVAVLTKAPLSSLWRMTSSSPIGFVALLRLVPEAGGQRGRMVVLAFAVLTVLATYLLVRRFEWKGRPSARAAALVVALVVMLAPVSLARNDLKPYTCDAFVAVLLLAVGAWAERAGTRRSLVALGLVAVVAVPFSSTTLFVAVAVLLGLFVAACIDRAWPRAREVAVAGVVIGGALIAYFAVVVVPNVNEHLRNYWESQYLRGSFGSTLEVAWQRFMRIEDLLGVPALVFVALFVLGLVVLARLRATSLAVALPLLWVEMIVVGRAQRYPFLDQRTSHFLLVASLVVVALGAVGLVGALSRLWLTTRPLLGTGIAAVVAITLAAVFFVDFHPYVRVLNVPFEDVRSETLAVAARRQRNDVVLVNSAGNFGFGYYWPHAHLTFHTDDSGQGFAAQVTGIGAIYAGGRDYAHIAAAVGQAVDRLRASPPGSRLYIVRTHMDLADADLWQEAFDAHHLVPREDVVGIEPVLVLDRSELPPR